MEMNSTHWKNTIIKTMNIELILFDLPWLKVNAGT